jgi:hypothetical protein
MNKPLTAPCTIFPECPCGYAYAQLDDRLAAWERKQKAIMAAPPDSVPPETRLEQQRTLDWITIDAESVLNCMARQRASQRIRAAAMINLAHPIWHRAIPEAYAHLDMAEVVSAEEAAVEERCFAARPAVFRGGGQS